MVSKDKDGGQIPGPLFFPGPPTAAALEWPGEPIGLSNTITQTKRRAPRQNKTLDRRPGHLEELVAKATRRLERAKELGRESFQHDVVIHGVRVRAYTNMPHLYDFWVDNWYSPEEWARVTGTPAPQEPRVRVYALGGVETEDVVAYYSRRTNTVLFFNSSYYGQLKSWVLGAVGRILAEEYGIHSIHGACVEYDSRGVLYIAATGTGKSTSSYGVMELPRTRFHSDDWVYVRYCLPLKNGEWVSPFRLELEGRTPISGSRVFALLPQAPAEARVKVLALDGRELECTAADLEQEAHLRAYAYISEKTFYLRTNLAESFPKAAPELLLSKCENVPGVGQDFLSLNRAAISAIVRAVKGAGGGALQELDSGELARWAGRLFAFNNARTMLDISRILGPERVYINPMEALPLRTVFLLQRQAHDQAILRSLDLAGFITALVRGITPAGTRETAYNDYRLVDDRRERHFVEFLEWELTGGNPSRAIDAQAFYRRFWEEDPPPTLREEVALFELLYRATRAYMVNTTLQADVRIKNVREAVRYTRDIMARTIAEAPEEIALTLDNYRQYVVSRRT